MKVLVAYATSEGQTRRIARHVADRITDAMHAVELLELSDANDVDRKRFDGAILAASLHVEHYQGTMSDFAAKQLDDIYENPTLFLSVSLATAGHEAEDWRGLDVSWKISPKQLVGPPAAWHRWRVLICRQNTTSFGDS